MIFRILGIFFTIYYTGMFVAILVGYTPNKTEIACAFLIAALNFVRMAVESE